VMSQRFLLALAAVVAAGAAITLVTGREAPIGGTTPADVSSRRNIAPASRTIPSSTAPQHAVLAHLKLADSHLGSEADVQACQALETRLESDIHRAGVGELDGNEIGGGECVLFMYGPDADRLFQAIEPALRSSPFARGGWVLKRYGNPDDPAARELRVDL